mgnify:CR=1 FL=1
MLQLMEVAGPVEVGLSYHTHLCCWCFSCSALNYFLCLGGMSRNLFLTAEQISIIFVSSLGNTLGWFSPGYIANFVAEILGFLVECIGLFHILNVMTGMLSRGRISSEPTQEQSGNKCPTAKCLGLYDTPLFYAFTCLEYIFTHQCLRRFVLRTLSFFY